MTECAARGSLPRFERKRLPAVDVAWAVGWRSITTMQRCDVQADEAGVLEVVLDPRRLREQGA